MAMNDIQKRVRALRRRQLPERLDAPLSPKLMIALGAQMIVGVRRYSAERIWAVMNGIPGKETGIPRDD